MTITKTPSDMQFGVIHKTNNYGDLIIIEYHSAIAVDVRFTETGYETSSSSRHIRGGNVKDKMRPSVFGVGYLGGDYYKVSNGGSSNHTNEYRCWLRVLERCYSDTLHAKHPTYIDCEICEEWQNFQVFAEWHEENKPKDGKYYELDKDIKIDGNRIYSPETCMFVSKLDNVLKMCETRIKSLPVNYLMSPRGKVFEVKNQKKFALENRLNQSGVNSVILGKQSHHKGWKLYIAQ